MDGSFLGCQILYSGWLRKKGKIQVPMHEECSVPIQVPTTREDP